MSVFAVNRPHRESFSAQGPTPPCQHAHYFHSFPPVSWLPEPALDLGTRLPAAAVVLCGLHVQRDSLTRTGSSPSPVHRLHSKAPHAHPNTFSPHNSGCPGQPATTAIIPPSISVPIPLRTLASPRHPPDDHSASLLQESNEKVRRHSSDSAGSDFSLWSDTGDLAEQLADEEDPLQIKLRDSYDRDPLGHPASKPSKHSARHVHYLPQDHLERKKTNPGIDKEAIQIPEPPPRRISRTEYFLALIMTGDRARSGSHGLTGKPLLWETVYNDSPDTWLTHQVDTLQASWSR